MLNRELLDAQLSELPLYVYYYIDPKELEFSSRIRWICEHECPMYGKTWACPPAVGEVDRCLSSLSNDIRMERGELNNHR